MIDTLAVTVRSPRKQRIAAVCEMARRIEVFCEDWAGEDKFNQLRETVTSLTFKHRRRYGGNFSESVATEVDYMIVVAFADAYELLSNHDGAVPAHMLSGPTEYLLALSIVASNSRHSLLMRALSSSDPKRVIESHIDIDELSHAARLINYGEDIRG